MLTRRAFAFPPPAALSDAAFKRLKSASFAILDKNGCPLTYGFFVTACGVALAASRDCSQGIRTKGRKKVVTVASCDDAEVDLEVVSAKVHGLGLDLAVLRLPSAEASQPYLPLPEAEVPLGNLIGHPLNLVHGSLAWSRHATRADLFVHSGRIVKCDATRLLYTGDAGAALLLHGEQVIGLHSQDRPDIGPRHRDALRLDAPAVRTAVSRAMQAR